MTVPSITKSSASSRRRARPRAPRLNAARRREHLLDVAASMIVSAGFDSLTMEGLAQKAGVSKGLGYAYFANAEELALALHDREIADLYHRIEEAITQARTFEEKVRLGVRVHFDTVAQRGVLLGLLQTKLSGRPRSRSLRARIAGFVGFWARLIADEFDVPPKTAESIAGATLSAADSLTRAWSAKLLRRAEVERICADYVLAGIRAAAAPSKRR